MLLAWRHLAWQLCWASAMFICCHVRVIESPVYATVRVSLYTAVSTPDLCGQRSVGQKGRKAFISLPNKSVQCRKAVTSAMGFIISGCHTGIQARREDLKIKNIGWNHKMGRQDKTVHIWLKIGMEYEISSGHTATSTVVTLVFWPDPVVWCVSVCVCVFSF